MAVLKESTGEPKFKFKASFAPAAEEEEELSASEEEEEEEESGSEQDMDGEEEAGSEENIEGEEEDIEGEEDDSDMDGDEEEGSDSDDDDDDIPNDEVDADDEDDEKSGWADAMAKVLGANRDVKNPLLAKAKRDRDTPGLNKKKGKDAEGDDEADKVVVQRESYLVRKAKKKEKEEICRARPNTANDRATERKLTKLATRGVVMLFNAVREQQNVLRKDLKDAGGSIRKREKVFKNIDKEGFLEVLGGGKKAKIGGTAGEEKVKAGSGRLSVPKKEEPMDEDEPMEIKEEDDEEEQSSWKILRDDYMMGAKMKDWDKESDSE